MKKYLIAALLLLVFSACTAEPFQEELLLPAKTQFYHGVYPGSSRGEESDITLSGLESYESTVGRRAAWVYFSNNWYQSRAFPIETASWIRETGSLPFIRLMLRSSAETYSEEHVFSLEHIIRGDFDADLRAWGQAAAAFATPLIVEWGTEMNGEWFSWNALWNGQAEGPELFKQAYRHIVETIRAQGAYNITWVFHVNADDDPDISWNRFENYYPGHDVVNWLGLSLYAAQTPYDGYWTDFRESMDEVIPRLNSMSDFKPVFLLEFGAPAANPLGDPALWADAALKDILANRWTSLKGFSWWNEAWQNDNNPLHDSDMRVQTVAGLAEVFRRHLNSEQVLERFDFNR